MDTITLSINGGPYKTYVEQGAAPGPVPPSPPPPVPVPPPPAPPPSGNYTAASMTSSRGAPVPVRFDGPTTMEYVGVGMQAGSSVNANTLAITVREGDIGLWTVSMVPGYGAGASFVHWAISLYALDFTGAGGYKGPERDANGTSGGNFAIGFGGYPGSDVNLPPGNYVLNIGRVGTSVGVDNKLISFIKQA